MSEPVTSTKPYLIRAIHEWAADNGLTPYLAVTVNEDTEVPREFVRAGEIVLNVSMTATDRLTLGNDFIRFQARFGGVARQISVPVEQVSAIYARENGQGMAFDVPKPLAVPSDDTQSSAQPEHSGKAPASADNSTDALSEPPDAPQPPPSPPPAGGRPRLTRVK